MKETFIKQYWKAYGGWVALFRSPYMWIAFIVSLMNYQFSQNENWIDTPLAILPNLLGFTLGGYSIWLALGNTSLNEILAEKERDEDIPSEFMVVNASFVHFIFLQILCLFLLIFIKTTVLKETIIFSIWGCYSPVVSSVLGLANLFNWFTFFLFLYSILSMLGALFALLNIASVLDILYRHSAEKKHQEKKDNE
ncbi:hypothetical protein MWMV10_MWMV10_00613 [Acinetobacter baumannii]|uniref:hypothetical protein n=1 Tax=Acinetobacter baumannii TaxID=470 RepID=UPI000991A0B9|nr:hypothetical protein [Acinetobacter baumannii]OOS31058.1 hypothetical protein BTG56_06975 [Acinetobacter baumannii]CAI4202106.1 hypothetical protein MWMV10_MWMV10_00613 [Acinetobacter baumannii]CAI4205267.1 hypothetical protein MWMV15_MWMV15_00190 [Acinetobacter baumannii]